MKTKRKISDIFAYIQGKFRYKIYYSSFRTILLRRHIYEQIMWRIAVMDNRCLVRGSCRICGCDTTALQMADKACPKPCYPPMMNKEEWRKFKFKQKVLKQYPITPDQVLKSNGYKYDYE